MSSTSNHVFMGGSEEDLLEATMPGDIAILSDEECLKVRHEKGRRKMLGIMVCRFFL